MQFHAKAVLESLLNSLDFLFLKRFWLPCTEVLGFQIFNGVPESESAIPGSKDVDSGVNNHKSCGFWNPGYFTLRDDYIILRPCLSIVHS